MTSRLKSIVAFALLGALSACAVHQSPLENLDQGVRSIEMPQKWLAHQAQASQIQTWKIKGKIAVKAGNKGGHATLRWDKREAEHIEIYGPLGGGRVVIDADGTDVRLRDTKGDELRGDSISALIEQRLGWPLPFDQLPFWVRGLPADSDASMQWDGEGRIEHMNDRGWQVSYPQYQILPAQDGTEMRVPRVIELNALPGTLRVYDKNGEYLGEDFFVRLIVKSWLF